MNENMPDTGDASRGAASKIREKAVDLAQGAKEQVRARYDERKSVAVGELGTLASSLRRVVDELGSSHPNNMSGRVVSTLADRIETFGQTLEGKDLDTIVGDVGRFARNNPAAFLGGALALGFMASRFLKSSTMSMASDRDFERDETFSGFSSGDRTDAAFGSTGYSGGAVPTSGLYGSGSSGMSSGSDLESGSSFGTTSGSGTAGGLGSSSSGFGTTGSGSSGSSSLDTPTDPISGDSDFNRNR